MKAVLRVLVLFFGIAGMRTSSFAQSGWYLQNPLPQGNTLWAVAALDSSIVLAAGEYGTILSTTDGGASWTLQSSGTTNHLRGVSFVDANTGWAVGGGGTILSTTDGGATWTPQSSGTTVALHGVSFVNANTGWAVGEQGTILKTDNGGGVWMRQQLQIPACMGPSFLGVSFPDANNGIAVGFCFYVGIRPPPRIPIGFRTHDGGATWVYTFYTVPPVFGGLLTAVSFADSQNAIAVGWYSQGPPPWPPRVGPIEMETTSGGDTWSGGAGPPGPVFDAVSYVDRNTVTIVGGLILRNGTRQPSGTNNFLYGVSFVDANTGWAVGAGGTILHTTTGGE